MRKKIKNLLFDLGNVIVDLDLDRTNRLFQELLGEHFTPIFQQLEKHDLFHQFEKGLISEETFIWNIQHAAQNLANLRLNPVDIIRCWNGMLLHIPLDRLEWLETLKEDYQVFLYSNTNSIHLLWVNNFLNQHYQIRDFSTRFFHKPYYSHLIHYRKPDKEGYEFILQDANILPEETFFIDDNADNIQGAQSVGLQTYLHPIGTEIMDVLNNELQKIN
ncbi:MAG: HAD family phosphatase [Saprospiraceae bacterium]|nr:HAD family phosphatase [Saprospiraceae bacterium]